MNPIALAVFGGVLIFWIAVLAVILFRNDGKLPAATMNRDILLPVGVSLAIWLYIFGLVVFNQ